MTITVLAIFVYLVLTAVAIRLTLQEQRRTDGRSARMMTMGFLACTFWPVTTLLMLVALHRRAA